MRWKDGRRSSNVEDRRNMPASSSMGGAGIFMLLRILPFLLRTKLGRILLALGVVGYFGARMLGIDLLQLGSGASTAQSTPGHLSAQDQEMGEFVAVVLAETENTWATIFKKMNAQYKEPTLVLFRQQINSACGFAQSAMGPFYCPADQKLYIDLAFYEDMKNKLGAPGDFAQAYVIAHEVGHHVQNLLGVSTKVHRAQQQSSAIKANALSVKLELQADCFAGIWGYYAQHESNMLEAGDIEEALTAAAAIGDDKLQQKANRTVRPETFTHGSSKQRVKWFEQGFTNGDIASCNTFN
jgi:uncharacterized protein